MGFSMILVGKGLTKLQDTADTIDATNQDIMKIHDEFVGITANLNTVSRDVMPMRDELVDFLSGDVCPLIPGSPDESSFRRISRDALDALNRLSDFITEELERVSKALRQVAHANSEVDQATQNLEFKTGAVVGIMIPYFIVPALLLVALLLGWTETYVEDYYWFITGLILPFFVIMVMFSFVAAGWAAIATEGNSDFCYGEVEDTPEATIRNILGRYHLTEGGLYYDAIIFYAHQCRISGPWGFLEEYFNDLISAKDTLNGMESAISEVSPESISQECGVDYSAILQLITQLQSHTTILSDTTKRSLDLLSCRTVVPLYTNTIYETMCQENIEATTWVFACSVIMSFFGMLMIMFRGACYPFFIWEDKDDCSTDEIELEEISEEPEDESYIDPSEMGSNIYEDEEGVEKVDSSAAYDDSIYEESAYEEDIRRGRN